MHRRITRVCSGVAAFALVALGALWPVAAAGAVDSMSDQTSDQTPAHAPSAVAPASDRPVGVDRAGRAVPIDRAGSVGVQRPVAVAPVAGEVVRAFERPDGPYGRGHRGVDLATRRGEPVRAALRGTVRFAGSVAGEMWITLVHPGGLETTYGGVASSVQVGQTVDIGGPVGHMRAGRRFLDWGARLDGAYIDPIGLLVGWRVRLVAVDDE
jgi:murein DD-endopeptidase MepM/ murein hydrolase activator NlpD